MRSHVNRRDLYRSLTPVVVAAALLVGCTAGPFSALADGDTPGPRTPAVDTPPEAPVAETPADAPIGAHTATLVLGGQSFTFNPTTCISGDNDVLISGPGVDDGSKEPAFLDVDFVGVELGWDGEVRVALGTDQPMTASGQFYSIRVGGDDDQSVGQVGFDDIAELRGDGAVREGGEANLGEGTLEVTCG